MTNNDPEDPRESSLKLIFPKKFSEKQKTHYKKLHENLSKLEENQLNISAVEITIEESGNLFVTAFIRSRLEKTVQLKKNEIVLMDSNKNIVAELEDDFDKIESIEPNTSQLYNFEFINSNDLDDDELEKMKHWSLAFKSNLEHYVDYSDLDESKIPDSTREYLQKIIDKMPLEENELSFVGFSAKTDKKDNLHVSLLIRNGTKDNLDIKQLPLKFYDASKELSAQGTFKIDGVSIRSNTSKPVSFVFPAKNILKDDLDLSSWSVEHVEE